MSRRASNGETSDSSPSGPENRRKIFSTLIFGHLGGDDQPFGHARGLNTSSETTNDERKEGDANKDEQLRSTSSDRLHGVLSQIDQQIPHDPIALRQTTLFHSALKGIQWQRDNYLTGAEYADWRKNEKDKQPNDSFYSSEFPSTANDELWYDDKAIAHGQIATLLGDFIPTSTVQRALTPIVAELPCGTLYETIRNATVGVILGQQSNLEQTIKSQLLSFLDNPENREAMKSSTQGIIIEKTNNNNGASNAERDAARNDLKKDSS
jgi:hypothetical protein